MFKEYTQNQIMLFPPSFDEMIEENHPVRVVNEVIDRLDLEVLFKKYKGGGSSSYHPRMLLKVLVYAYLSNTYSSRRIESAIKENIHFMWLSGMQKPDHNTINRFRSEKLKGVLKEIFSKVVLLLVESGHIDLKTIYIDGTKIEANANKYTFVWGKAISKNKIKIREQLEDLWNYAETVAAEEMKDKRPCDFEKLDPNEVDRTIDELNSVLKPKKEVCKKRKQKLNYMKNNFSKNLRKYEKDEAILDGRNSYSKTDPDATFMRMKEDHMQNGQLKPGYNLQFGTNNQFILNYSLHPNPNDTLTFIPHLNQYFNFYQLHPDIITADAGYGSEENYKYIDQIQATGYVKYNSFHKEQNPPRVDKKPFTPDKLTYVEEGDFFVCPIGQKMTLTQESHKSSSTGFKKEISVYKAQNCDDCPLKSSCHKGKGNRRLEVNHKLRALKSKAKNLLLSDDGCYHMKKRATDVETVFGNLKQNKGFKRFMLHGIEKVEVEIGLLSIAMNLKKLATS